jgi:hypothetical protein
MKDGTIFDELSVGCTIEVLDPGPNDEYYGAGDTAEVIGWDGLSILCRFNPSPTVNPGHPKGVEPYCDGPYEGVWWVEPSADNTKVLEAK